MYQSIAVSDMGHFFRDPTRVRHWSIVLQIDYYHELIVKYIHSLYVKQVFFVFDRKEKKNSFDFASFVCLIHNYG